MEKANAAFARCTSRTYMVTEPTLHIQKTRAKTRANPGEITNEFFCEGYPSQKPKTFTDPASCHN